MPRILTQAHVDRFRNRLCDVAARLYFEMGHSDFNMRDLASRVGVSAMTPYRYFGDKDGILAAVRARGVARLTDQLESAVPGGPVALMQTYINFAMEEAAYYRLIFDLSQPSAPLAELKCQEHRLLSAMAAATAVGRTNSDIQTPAFGFWAALHGGICLVLAGKLSEAELGELASQIAWTFLGVGQRFIVPPIQAAREEAANFGSNTLHPAAAANIAAE